MSFQDFIPFHDYFFGVPKVKPTPEEEFDFFAWLFGQQKPPPPPVPDDSYFTGIFSLKQSYDFAIDEALNLYGPDEAEKSIRRLHVNLCLSPLMALMIFLTFAYAVKLAYRGGRPFIYALMTLMQQAIQGEEKSGIEKRVDSMERLITNTVKKQQNECVSNMKRKMGNLIDDHSRVLNSTQSRLQDITEAVQDLIKTSTPLTRLVEGKEVVDTGDASNFPLFKP